jgi:DNA replicative helicase MCM subunit Mcm2 (Cdc46/Mcm family)
MAYFEVSFSARYSICVEAEDAEEAQMLAEQTIDSAIVDVEWECEDVDEIVEEMYYLLV